jgi:hypothetical protein
MVSAMLSFLLIFLASFFGPSVGEAHVPQYRLRSLVAAPGKAEMRFYFKEMR